MPLALSFTADQVSDTLEAVVPGTLRPLGTAGAVLLLDGFVVTRASALSGETLSAASRATTVNTNGLPGTSLVIVVFVTLPSVWSCWPCFMMLYPTTALLSVDAVQLRSTVVSVTLPTL